MTSEAKHTPTRKPWEAIGFNSRAGMTVLRGPAFDLHVPRDIDYLPVLHALNSHAGLVAAVEAARDQFRADAAKMNGSTHGRKLTSLADRMDAAITAAQSPTH